MQVCFLFFKFHEGYFWAHFTGGMTPELLPVVFTVIVGLTFPYLPIFTSAEDNTDLLMSTLRNKFVFACDKDVLTIKCPNNTEIVIDSANYGRQVPNEHMCPYRWSTIGTYEVREFHEDTNCKALNSRQVTENLCESRSYCKISVSSDLFGEDPCPATHKYLDVTYKCKPNTFDHAVKCEDSHMMLHCDDKDVLAIHSADFGRPSASNMECPSFSMDETECSSSSSLEEVMKRCHGKRHCTVKASTRIFGQPCKEGTYKYLSVIYSCVSKKIFRKPRRYIGLPTVPQRVAVHPTSPGLSRGTGGQTIGTMAETTDLSQDWGSFGMATANHSILGTTPDTNRSREPGYRDQDEPMGLFTSFIAAIGTIQLNAEVFILYTCLGCCLGIIGTLLWFVVRLKCKNHHLKEKIKESGAQNATDANRTLSRNGSVLESVRQENRVDINEIWSTPPPVLSTSASSPSIRPENGINANQRWDQANTLPRDTHSLPRDTHTLPRETNSNTLPATRNLNSYFP